MLEGGAQWKLFPVLEVDFLCLVSFGEWFLVTIERLSEEQSGCIVCEGIETLGSCCICAHSKEF